MMNLSEENKGLEEYKKSVQILSKNKSSEIFPNDSIRHAKIILDEIIDTAEKKISIFSEKLDDAVYTDVELIKSIKDFLEIRKGSLEVIVQTLSSEEIKTKKIYKDLFSCNNVKWYSGNNNPSISELKYNFLSADDRAYRMEFDIVKHRAGVCFNDQLYTKKIMKKFEDLKKISTQV